MRARIPNIDFKEVSPHWGPYLEFSQLLNAGSVSAPHVEAYLNVALDRAMNLLPSDEDDLRRQIAVFRDQETNHLRLHSMFNRRLYESGYRRVRDFEVQLKSDLGRFLDTRSLRFNLAYAAGFECFSHFMAKYVFEGVPELFGASDQRMAELWRWHTAEEYEHRSTCFDAYMRLYGGYFYRIYGLLFSFVHLMGLNTKIYGHLLAEDRKAMTSSQRRESARRDRALKRLNARYFWMNAFHVLSPFYDPRHEPPAKGLSEVLALY